jgi:glycerol-3-phosphate acyltransferase PlsY
MSIASLCAALAYPLLIWHFAPEYLYFSIGAAAFLMIMHMTNIKRIAKGEEKPLTIGGSGKSDEKEQTK